MSVTQCVQRTSVLDMTAIFAVAIDDIERVPRTRCHFVRALYDTLDRYARNERFHFNVALSGLETQDARW